MSAKKAYDPSASGKNKAKYWKQMKSLHPRHKISTPEELWELACDYFAENAEEVYNITQLVKGGHLAGQLAAVPTQKPLTWQGFTIFLRGREIINSIADYRNNARGAYAAYQPVILDIDAVLFDNMLSGGATGKYDSGVATRVLGLINKEETKVVAEQPLFVLTSDQPMPTQEPAMDDTDDEDE